MQYLRELPAAIAFLIFPMSACIESQSKEAGSVIIVTDELCYGEHTEYLFENKLWRRDKVVRTGGICENRDTNRNTVYFQVLRLYLLAYS